MKIFVLFLSSVTTIPKVSSLDCFFTDPESMKNNSFLGHELPARVGDCLEHVKKSLADSETPATLNVLNDGDVSCYGIDLSIGEKVFALKTCTTRRGCAIMKRIVTSEFSPLDPDHDVYVTNCQECRADKCNSGTRISDMRCCVSLLSAFAVVIKVHF